MKPDRKRFLSPTAAVNRPLSLLCELQREQPSGCTLQSSDETLPVSVQPGFIHRVEQLWTLCEAISSLWALTHWPSRRAACWPVVAPRLWTATPAGRSTESSPGRQLQETVGQSIRNAFHTKLSGSLSLFFFSWLGETSVSFLTDQYLISVHSMWRYKQLQLSGALSSLIVHSRSYLPSVSFRSDKTYSMYLPLYKQVNVLGLF